MDRYTGRKPRQGRFEPINTENLQDGAEKYIGTILWFAFAWEIPEEDSDEYGGQFAYTATKSEDSHDFLPESFTWCPEEDISWLT